MNTPRQARRDARLTRDDRYRFKARIGRTEDGRRPVFVLGKVESAARERRDRIADLWDSAVILAGRDCWNARELAVARAIGSGAYDRAFRDSLLTQAAPFTLDASSTAGPTVGPSAAPSTPTPIVRLHDALTAYRASVASRRETPSLHTRLGQIDRLFAGDTVLADFHSVQALFDYWRDRPLKPDGTHYAANTCHQQIKELTRALKWVSFSADFPWTLPEGDYSKRLRLLPEELRAKTTKAIRGYSVDELAVLYSHATDIERLLIMLGLNCAFGAAESGRLHKEDVITGHPNADVIQYPCDGRDFIVCLRPKTHVVGNYLLWDKTAELLRQAIKRADSLNSPAIICRSTGRPLYSESAKNAQTGFSNKWKRLIKRASVQSFPFGSLRDLSADTVRRLGGAELASLHIQHGRPVKDNLLQYYSNAPIGELFAVQAKMEDYFSPVWS